MTDHERHRGHRPTLSVTRRTLRTASGALAAAVVLTTVAGATTAGATNAGSGTHPTHRTQDATAVPPVAEHRRPTSVRAHVVGVSRSKAFVVTTTGRRKILTYLPFDARNVAASPDGQQIVMTQYLDSTANPPVTSAPLYLASTRAAPAVITLVPAIDGDVVEDAWWTSRTDVVYLERAAATGVDTLYTIKSDGTGNRVLATGLDVVESTLSDDGAVFAYTQGNLESTLCVLTLATGARHCFEPRDFSYAGPELSPDGTMIAYDGEASVYTMRADGTRARKLRRGDFDTSYDNLRWSPSGTRLLVEQSGGGGGELGLYVIKRPTTSKARWFKVRGNTDLPGRAWSGIDWLDRA